LRCFSFSGLKFFLLAKEEFLGELLGELLASVVTDYLGDFLGSGGLTLCTNLIFLIFSGLIILGYSFFFVKVGFFLIFAKLSLSFYDAVSRLRIVSPD
jgi:hypothetical protein